MNYNYDVQKYIFERKIIDEFYNMYDKLNKYKNNSFSYKIVKNGTNSRILIYINGIDEEIASYGPCTKFISIEKKYLDYFNTIRKEIYSMFIIEHESWFEVRPYEN